MAKEITMPKLSDTMEEGKLLRWLKHEGDRVERGDVIAEVETDKADMEMEAFDSGVLLAITVAEGETAAVGAVIGYVGKPGEKLETGERAGGGKKEAAGAPPASRPEKGSAREERAQAGAREKKPVEKGRGEPGGVKAGVKDGGKARAAAGNGAPAKGRPAPERRQSAAPARAAAAPAKRARHESAELAGPHADIADVIEPEVEEEAEGEEGSAKQAPAGAQLPARQPRPTRGLNDRLPFRPDRDPRAERLKISPLARRLAREAGLDASGLEGSGPDGRIVRADVERALRGRRGARTGAAAADAAGDTAADSRARTAAEGATAPPAEGAAGPPVPSVPIAAGELGAEIPHSRIRRVVAERMAESKRTVPHFYTTVAVRMERSLELREALELRYPEARVSVTHLIVKAAALALERYPRVNAVFEDDRIRIPSSIHIGLAVAVEDGLLVPVIRDSAAKSLPEIAREARAAAARARSGKLAQDDLQGATFSISNLGMFSIEQFAAIITPPQSAILAVGGTADEPVVQDGRVVPGKVMRLTLSADHRVIDGVLAAAFLVELKGLLEAPLALVV